MDRVIAIEEARKKLGQLIREAASSKKPIVIARRNSERAVLIGYDEYERLTAQEMHAAEGRFQEALERIHSAVAKAGLKRKVVEEAIRKVRSS
jgi:prevent-host-death family protein